MNKNEKLSFASDYMRGAHPAIMERLAATNGMKTAGYGADPISEEAREKIRKACRCDSAEVEFLIGGTQTNALVIDAFLRPYEGVIAPQTGHIGIHEAGAVEASGHKVLALPHTGGKLSADDVRQYLTDFYADENHEHMVFPGMVCVAHPTEYGTLYSRQELKALSDVCHSFNIPLYLDGARLAYAFACPENDLTLPDLAELCDAFYIGGTKCGALFGEALVVPKPDRIPHLFTMIKQHGALLAKGRLLGLQFDTLFTDDLYLEIGRPAIRAADRIRKALLENGYELPVDSPTNQVFTVLTNAQLNALSQEAEISFWEKAGEDSSVIRFATDWATSDEETEALTDLLARLK